MIRFIGVLRGMWSFDVYSRQPWSMEPVVLKFLGLEWRTRRTSYSKKRAKEVVASPSMSAETQSQQDLCIRCSIKVSAFPPVLQSWAPVYCGSQRSYLSLTDQLHFHINPLSFEVQKALLILGTAGWAWEICGSGFSTCTEGSKACPNRCCRMFISRSLCQHVFAL